MNLIGLLVIIAILLFVWGLNQQKSSTRKTTSETQKVIKDILEKLRCNQLETLRIKPLREPPKHPWSSKFGGQAYWPLGEDYPQTKQGERLHLLAQLNFEEMPHIEGFPQHGILQFFIANDGMYGLDFDKPHEELISNPNAYRVIFHPNVIHDFNQLDLDIPSEPKNNQLPVSGEYSLTFEVAKELPAPTDYRFDDIATNLFNCEDEVASYFFDNVVASGSKLGGYAHFTQDDPRRVKHGGNWILLFQMDTEFSDGIDIMWGDAGVGNFFIEPDALRKKDFSRIWYNWDCC